MLTAHGRDVKIDALIALAMAYAVARTPAEEDDSQYVYAAGFN